MRKSRKYMCYGLILNSINLLFREFSISGILPDFFQGLCLGLALVFLISGLWMESNNMIKVKSFKEKLLMKVIK